MNSEEKPGDPADENDLPAAEKKYRQEFQAGFEKGFKLGLEQGGQKNSAKEGEDGKKKSDQDGKNAENQDKSKLGKDEKKQPIYRRPAFIIISIAVVLLLVGGSLFGWFSGNMFPPTTPILMAM